MARLVLPIIFGAAFTVATCAAIGSLLLARMCLPLRRRESILMAFVAGAACLSLAIFGLCVVHQARPGVFLAGGAAAIAGATWKAAGQSSPRPPLGRFPSTWIVLFFLILASFSIIYLFNSVAPEVSPDGSGYHLGNVHRYWNAHGFDWRHRSLYSSMPQGLEMLFLMAYSFGGNCAAALVHSAFLLALPLVVAAFGARIGSPRAGLFAGLLAFTSPVAGIAGVSAYNDLAVATVLFAEFYLLQVWDDDRATNYLILIGLLSGFAVSIKYTAALVIPFAAAFVWWRSRSYRHVFRVLAAAAIAVVPWVVRNWIWTGNPLAPFLNRWFPNPFFHPGAEQRYLADLHHYQAVGSLWEILVQLAFRGGKIPGIVGPVFLLAPLALLALRHRHGRRLLLAAVVFGLPVCSTWMPGS